MAEIALSTYLEEINTLIDEGRPGEAIVHARHILEHYPSQVDAYRLLAKALLEQGQTADAADLFQRVLSVYPDDFISHAGLAVVRKQEGQIKQALWHMERAFEIEPYNLAIREELNDLYGRRDGMPPEQLLLNRPALARLYVTGEMYPQAIVELRGLLSETDRRLDLQVLLAEALWRAGRGLDAVDTCMEVLDQLPNCVQANAIVADVWLSTGRVEEAQPYLRRVQRLKQLSQADLRGDAVVALAFKAEGANALPEEIVLERLPEQTALGTMEGEAAEWVDDVGFEEGEPDLDWLRVFEDSESSVVEAPESEGGEMDGLPDWFDDDVEFDGSEESGRQEPGPDDQAWSASKEVDDWLAGGNGSDFEDETAWDDASGEVVEEEASADEPLAEGLWEDDETEDADSPDWLQLFDGEEADLADASEWLDDELDELAAEETDWEEWLEAEAASEGEELPDWLVESTDSSAQGSKHADDGEDVAPEWLDAGADVDATVTDAGESTAGVSAGSVESDEIFELEEVAMGSSEEPRKEKPEEEAPEADVPEVPEPGAQEEDLDWLKELGEAVDEGAPAGQGDAQPAAEADLPAWLRDEMEGEAAPGGSLDWFETEGAQGSPESDEAGSGVTEGAHSQPDEGSKAGDPEFGDEDLSWLDQIAAGEGQPIEEPPTFSWPDEKAPTAEEQPAGLDAGDDTPEDLEEAIAWLEQLAEQEGIDSDQLPSVGQLTDDEEQAEELFEGMPEDAEEAMAWLEQLAADEMAVQEEGHAPPPEPVEEEPTPAAAFEAVGDGDELDWLDDLTTEEQVEAEEWLSDWVDEEPAAFEEEKPQDEPIHAEKTGDQIADPATETDVEDREEELIADPLVAELEPEMEELRSSSMAEPEGEESPLEEAFSEEIDEAEVTVEETVVAEGDTGEFDWLDNLDVEGAPEPVAEPEPEVPADRHQAEAVEEEALPDWLAEMASDEGEIEESGEDVALRALLAAEGAEAGDEGADEERIDAAVEEFFSDVAEGELDELEWDDVAEDEEGVPEIAAEDEALQAAIAAADEDDELLAWLDEEVDDDRLREILADVPDDQEEALDFLEDLAAEAEQEEAEATAPETETESEPDLDLGEDLAWMETLVETGEDTGIGPAADVIHMVEGEEDDVPEDLEEAMAWLEQLAAQQGAPLDELPSFSPSGQSPDPSQEERAIDEPAQEPPVEEQVLVAAEGEEPVAAVEAEETEGPEPVEGIDEAMFWLQQLEVRAGATVEEAESEAAQSDLAGEIPDDPEEALTWLEQLAGRANAAASSEPAYADQVVEEPETPAMAHDVSMAMAESQVEAEGVEEELLQAAPETASAEAVDARAEEEMLEEIPEDPDEAMAWLEQLAARQGASLDELPSVQEVAEEVEIPAWVAREAEREEEEARAEGMAEAIDAQDVEELESDGDLDWLDELEESESARPVDEDVTPAAFETPPAAAPIEEEEESAEPALELPEAGVEESFPEWLGLDEADETGELQWTDAATDLGDWLTAEEEEFARKEPESEPLPRQDAVASTGELGSEPASPEEERAPAEPSALPPIPAGLDLDEEQLASGREAIKSGEYDRVVMTYQSLLESEQGLNLIIGDLETAVAEAGENPRLSRLLGDAYMRNGQLQKALESYRRALDML